jgi:subtilisin family serine protease
MKIILMLFILFSIGVNSQEKISYNTKEGIITFEISKKLIFIETKEPLSNFSDEKIVNKEDNFIVVETTDKDYDKKTETLKSKFTTVEPVLIYKNGTKQICFNEMIIKIKPEYNIDQILIDKNYKSTVNQYNKNQYLIKLNNYDTNKTFNLISSLSKDNRIEFIEPNFLILNAFQTNDPFYSSQWAINNNGYLGGISDADMDVYEAWTLSTGSGIKVAVLDVGVDLVHPDLQANLLPGYDAINGVSGGGYIGASYHGTPCAGIIGAVANNNIGISGVAYNSKIIPIRVGTGTTITTSAAITGINWASNNGADVLSNSWRLGSVSEAVNNAINYAATSGRNGKGCVVLFATGNENSSVSWPASNSQVIAVGASSQCDQRKSLTSCDGETWWGSNFGENLDIVAPGVKIYTTDISSSAGYNTAGDYISDFNGTSSACPNAAGVVALILSVNPNLTGIQARQILESSTDKISGYVYSSSVSGQPNGTWNNEVGYGRINAYKAVQMAQCMASNAQISGNNIICNSETYLAPVGGTSYNWTITEGASLVTLTGNGTASITLTAIPYLSGQVTLSLSMGNNCGNVIGTKNIWVGVPQFNVVRDATQNESCDTKFHYVPFYINTPPNSTIEILFLSPQVTYTVGSNNLYTFNFPKGYSGPFEYIISSTNTCGTYIYDSVDMGDSNMISNCNSMGLANTNLYKIYPNPTNNVINVSLADENEKPITTSKIIAELYDFSGQSKQKVEVKNNTASISVVGLQKGVYILNIIIDGKTEGHQIIIE